MRLRRIQLLCLSLALCVVGIAAGNADDKPKISLKLADAATLDVKALWKPISESHFNFHRDWPALRDFRPAKDAHRYGATDFRSFLPSDSVAVGEAWKIDTEGALAFLRQFHPGASTKLHINNGDSQGGGYATLARYNHEFAEIVFRFHGEFILDAGWLTPGRFMGQIVVDRAKGDIVFFRMFVPPNRVNYDAGWRRGKREIEFKGKDGKTRRGTIVYPASTDDGKIEQMELIGGDAAAIKDAKWTVSKTDAELEETLGDRFYAFSKIKLVPFEDALAAARKSGKPLHLIVLSGWLDDESC